MLAVPVRGVEARLDQPKPTDVPGRVDDGELVRRFVAAGDPAAFETLVRRHGPMVFGACRRMLRDPHDADDAFQATFLVLLRKAGSVRPPERVGNWLYGVACRTAAKANSMKLRRTQIEREAPVRTESAAEDDGGELRSMLDAELARMPERYRAPIVMCELDGMSRREAAMALRLAEGTLSSRLARARDLLRTRLTRRGLALSSGALVAGLTAESASAWASVPEALLESVGKGAMVGSGVAGAVPGNAALLAKGVIKAMWISKLQTVAATTLLIGTIGTAAGVVTHHVVAREKQVSVSALGHERQNSPGVATVIVPAPPLVAPLVPRGRTDSAALPAKDQPIELAVVGKDFEPPAVEYTDLSTGRAAKEGEKAPPAAPGISTTVQAIDAPAGTITATLPEAGKKAPPTTLKLATDVRVELAGIGKGSDPTSGTIAEVTPGLSVILRLSSDGLTVTHIFVLGEHLVGTVKALDPTDHSITVEKQSKAGGIEKTLPLHTQARIAFAGTAKSKKEPAAEAPPEVKFSDLAVGMHVAVSISADRKFITGVTIEIPSASGSVASLDPAKRIISITGKGKGGVTEQVFTLAPDAAVSVGEGDGKKAGTLADVTVGMAVSLQLSPRDPTMATSLHAWTPVAKPAKGEK